jgi:hypothetical protein
MGKQPTGARLTPFWAEDEGELFPAAGYARACIDAYSKPPSPVASS